MGDTPETGRVKIKAGVGYYPSTGKFYVIQTDEDGKPPTN